MVPKEHGAWAVLYGAFLAGAGVAGRAAPPVILLLVGVTAVALANGPLAVLVRSAPGQAQTERRPQALRWLALYGGVAGVAFALLLLAYGMTFLLPLGMGAAIILLLRVVLIRGRDDRTLPGELVGMAGLTLVGPAAHAVAVGEAQPVGAVLWLLLLLFFASAVFYVRMRIHAMIARRKGSASPSLPALWSCLLYHGLLLIVLPMLVILQVIPWPVLLGFAPALWRAGVGLRRDEVRLDLRRLGWSEVAVATAFVLLLIAAFRFTPIAG
jgi:hypothetical protein